MSARSGRIAGWGLALLFLANAGVVVALWLGGGGLQDIHDSASFLVGLALLIAACSRLASTTTSAS